MYTDTQQKCWDLCLPLALLAYRTSVQSASKFTPFFLLYGRDAVLPREVELTPSTLSYSDELEYASWLAITLKQAYEKARQGIENAQKQQQRQYNRSIHGSFQINDLVMLFNPRQEKGKATKLLHKWVGPFKVTEKRGPNVFVQPAYTGRLLPRFKPQWVSICMIKLYSRASPEPTNDSEN